MPVKVPPDLIAAVKEGKCVPVVGSGLSVLAGMPSWHKLINDMISEGEKLNVISDGDGLRREVDKGRLLEVADYVRQALGPFRYSKLLQEKFATPSKPTKNHEILVDTPYRGIITTNYDKILETAYTLRYYRPPRTISWDTPASIGTVLYDKDFFLFKLHGEVDRIDSIILTKRDYDQIMFRNPHIRTFLQAILLTNVLFFVGYSMSDPDFEIVIAESSLLFAGTGPLSFALLPNPSEAVIQNLKLYRNIMVIPYDPHDNHVEVTEALETIRDECRAD